MYKSLVASAVHTGLRARCGHWTDARTTQTLRDKHACTPGPSQSQVDVALLDTTALPGSISLLIISMPTGTT